MPSLLLLLRGRLALVALFSWHARPLLWCVALIAVLARYTRPSVTVAIPRTARRDRRSPSALLILARPLAHSSARSVTLLLLDRKDRESVVELRRLRAPVVLVHARLLGRLPLLHCLFLRLLGLLRRRPLYARDGRFLGGGALLLLLDRIDRGLTERLLLHLLDWRRSWALCLLARARLGLTISRIDGRRLLLCVPIPWVDWLLPRLARGLDAVALPLLRSLLGFVVAAVMA